MDNNFSSDFEVRRRRALATLFLALGAIPFAFVSYLFFMLAGSSSNKITVIYGMLIALAVSVPGLILAIVALVKAHRMIATRDSAYRGRAIASRILGIGALVYLAAVAVCALLVIIIFMIR